MEKMYQKWEEEEYLSEEYMLDDAEYVIAAYGTSARIAKSAIEMLREKGVEPKAMGVEVISDAILAKGVAEAAKYNFDNTVKVLAEAWPEAMPEK